MAEADLFRTVWTLNFDGFVARAAADFDVTPIEVGADCPHRLPPQPRKGELVCVSLHGDYRYDWLRNTPDELQAQDSQLRDALVAHVTHSPLIVSGYSGRDESLLDALREAYSEEGNGSLYWCGYGNEISSQVADLITLARSRNRTAHFVPSEGFDDLMGRLSLHCLSGEARTKALDPATSAIEVMQAATTAFEVDSLTPIGLIKSNAFEVECPSEVFAFEPKQWPAHGAWKWLDEVTANYRIVAVPFRKVLSLGRIEDIRRAFKDKFASAIERVPITLRDLRFQHSAIHALMRRALVRALAETADCHTDGRSMLWEKGGGRRVKEGSHDCTTFEAVVIYLRSMGRGIHLVLKPSVRVEGVAGEELPDAVVNAVRLRILSGQYNKQFNKATGHWRDRLLQGRPVTTLEFPPTGGSTFRFKIRASPIFATLGSSQGGKAIQLTESLRRHVKQKGVILPEPRLIFSDRAASERVTEWHPLRGLTNNRPFDFAITQRGLATSVRIGVVCPRAESPTLAKYLAQAGTRTQPMKTERDYLLEYPGFDNAFGLPLHAPQPGDSGWQYVPDPESGVDPQTGSLALGQLLTNAIDTLDASQKPHVVLVYIPYRWGKWRKFESDNEQFDLHDYVKAYCIQKGIATQFLEQHTLDQEQQCRVWWWLSLALYAKAMRTPWVLSGLDPDTAFVGLGFTIRHHAERGRHVVLGCSHLYNAQGEGLQFRLSTIENPTVVRGNPFMSRDDARRLGETVRTLFFESRMRLPSRVVIHKLTPFRKEEREGINDGLTGVDEIELIELTVEDALRYVSSVPKGNRFDEDSFPVRRGSAVVLSKQRAMLWIHGVTDALQPGWRYYKGKRRIPAPVVLHRYQGRSELSTIANEILGLSKMDWNSADMYSRLPATVSSSQKIARIGSLLPHLGPTSYDYRLFM